MSGPYYVEIYKNGMVAQHTYEPGSSSDWAAKNGHKKFLAYRIKVTPKQAPVDPGKARQLINSGLAYKEPLLPPVSHQMLKALGAFGMLFLVMAFAVWFMRDLFQ